LPKIVLFAFRKKYLREGLTQFRIDALIFIEKITPQSPIFKRLLSTIAVSLDARN